MLVLQRQPNPGEIELFSERSAGRQTTSALNGDLEAMLALLSLLDDYVGVSNTNMHLRAGVGKAGARAGAYAARMALDDRGRNLPVVSRLPHLSAANDGGWTRALEQLGADLRLSPRSAAALAGSDREC